LQRALRSDRESWLVLCRCLVDPAENSGRCTVIISELFHTIEGTQGDAKAWETLGRGRKPIYCLRSARDLRGKRKKKKKRKKKNGGTYDAF